MANSFPEVLKHPLLPELNIIRTLIDLNQNHAAVILLTDLIRKHPDDFFLYFLRGLALLEEGNAQDALNDLNKSLQLKPDYPPAMFQAGFIYVQRTQLNEAHALFSKLKKLDSMNPHIYHYLGLIAHMKNEKEKAIRYWKKALRLNPHFLPAVYNLKLYDIRIDTIPTLEENLAEAQLVDQRRQIEAKIREINVFLELKNAQYELYVGKKGLVWLSATDQKAFTFINEGVRVQELDRPKVKEVLKILKSMVVYCANDYSVDDIFWELDFGKGQYFLYYRRKINDFQWAAYHEGRFQLKKIPVFFKFRINSNSQMDDLRLNGNVFLIQQDKTYYLIDNLGTEISYQVIDTLNPLQGN